MIGIDGFEWSVIEELIEKGKMKNTKNLIEEGVKGKLGTLKLPSSGLRTTISTTGKNPEEHDIRGWIRCDKGTYKPVQFMSYHRKVKVAWNILSEQGLTVQILNYLVTRPAEDVFKFRKKIFLEELETSDNDVIFIYFEILDVIQHMFCGYIDKNHPNSKEDQELKNIIFEYYLKIDDLVGKVLM